MPLIHNGVTWYVSGVDSVSTHNEYGDEREKPLWCRHDEYGGDFTETPTHIKCENCGRAFKKIHPVTAEKIVRDYDTMMIQMQEMMNNV